MLIASYFLHKKNNLTKREKSNQCVLLPNEWETRRPTVQRSAEIWRNDSASITQKKKKQARPLSRNQKLHKNRESIICVRMYLTILRQSGSDKGSKGQINKFHDESHLAGFSRMRKKRLRMQYGKNNLIAKLHVSNDLRVWLSVRYINPRISC